VIETDPIDKGGDMQFAQEKKKKKKKRKKPIKTYLTENKVGVPFSISL
jgi:hypothetical protein